MAQNDLDSNPNGGTSPAPTGEGSTGKGDSGGSFDAVELKSAIEALTKRLDEVDARSKSLQGDKDRAVTKTKNEVDELKRKIAEIEKLKKSGLNEEEALHELSFREEVRSIREQIGNLNQAQPSTTGNGNGLSVDAAKVISEYGLDGNDPDVITNILSKKFDDERDLKFAALDLAYRRTKNAPSAAAAPPATGTTPKVEPLDVLRKEYQTKLEALQKEGRPNPAQIADLKSQMRKKGLEVW